MTRPVFFITYPVRIDALNRRYTLIPEETYEMARARAFRELGSTWAFIYEGQEELERQIEAFHLEPVTFEEARKGIAENEDWHRLMKGKIMTQDNGMDASAPSWQELKDERDALATEFHAWREDTQEELQGLLITVRGECDRFEDTAMVSDMLNDLYGHDRYAVREAQLHIQGQHRALLFVADSLARQVDAFRDQASEE